MAPDGNNERNDPDDVDAPSEAYRSTLRLTLPDGRVVVDPPLDGLATGTSRAPVPARAVAVVRSWNDDEGWGVVDARDVPGGCWVHFSVVETPGLGALTPGQAVVLHFEAGGQDGFAYRAVRVEPSPGSPR